MENGEDFRLVFVTTGSEENARDIARTLTKERLAACCTMISGAVSIYRWQGNIEESRETQLLIKTSATLLDLVEQRIQQLHSYDTPEIIAVTLNEISAPYLDWLRESLL